MRKYLHITGYISIDSFPLPMASLVLAFNVILSHESPATSFVFASCIRPDSAPSLAFLLCNFICYFGFVLLHSTLLLVFIIIFFSFLSFLFSSFIFMLLFCCQSWPLLDFAIGQLLGAFRRPLLWPEFGESPSWRPLNSRLAELIHGHIVHCLREISGQSDKGRDGVTTRSHGSRQDIKDKSQLRPVQLQLMARQDKPTC